MTETTTSQICGQQPSTETIGETGERLRRRVMGAALALHTIWTSGDEESIPSSESVLKRACQDLKEHNERVSKEHNDVFEDLKKHNDQMEAQRKATP